MSRTFFRKFFTAVPRAAGRPALRASALRGGEFGIIRAPGAPGAGNPPAHRMPTTPARRSGGDGGRFGREGGIGLDDCEKYHRALQPLVEDVDYDIMEVSSAGMDRPIKTRRDFEKNRDAQCPCRNKIHR